jgi:hypothetical protein
VNSILKNPRTHRALLDEYVPDWRELAGDRGNLFEFAWMRATGQDRTSAWRWKTRAEALLSSPQSLSEAA